MTAADHQHGTAHGHERFQGACGLVIGVVLLVGRGAVSRLVADLAGVGPQDRVLDVGCGPGGAAREAARRGAAVTGVDPAPLMLALGRRLSCGQSGRGIAFVEGTAEALPVADRSVTVAWAISSAHHWADVAAGLRELHRVLEPGGRLIIAERLARPGARASPPTASPARRPRRPRPRHRRPASPAPGTRPTGPAGERSPSSARTAPPVSPDDSGRVMAARAPTGAGRSVKRNSGCHGGSRIASSRARQHTLNEGGFGSWLCKGR